MIVPLRMASGFGPRSRIMSGGITVVVCMKKVQERRAGDGSAVTIGRGTGTAHMCTYSCRFR